MRYVAGEQKRHVDNRENWLCNSIFFLLLPVTVPTAILHFAMSAASKWINFISKWQRHLSKRNFVFGDSNRVPHLFPFEFVYQSHLTSSACSYIWTFEQIDEQVRVTGSPYYWCWCDSTWTEFSNGPINGDVNFLLPHRNSNFRRLAFRCPNCPSCTSLTHKHTRTQTHEAETIK